MLWLEIVERSLLTLSLLVCVLDSMKLVLLKCASILRGVWSVIEAVNKIIIRRKEVNNIAKEE